MKKSIFAAAALTCTLFFTIPAFAADQVASDPPQFSHAIQDLPLMPGLQPVEDEDVLFDAPGSGRIAETNAMGPVDVDAVYKFYSHSLPHLGWRVVNAHTYRRENEELKIDATANQKVTVVKFTVKPTAGG